jgi:uncharacterized membrane protein
MESKISKETHNRSFIKSFIWRIVGVLILGGVTYFYTRHWIQTTWITFLHHGVFLFVFWGHERFWLCVNIHGFKRKICKMFTYETILGNFILAIISLAITGNVQTMTKITLTYIGIKHFVYIWNEFIWDRITFGRYQKSCS